MFTRTVSAIQVRFVRTHLRKWSLRPVPMIAKILPNKNIPEEVLQSQNMDATHNAEPLSWDEEFETSSRSMRKNNHQKSSAGRSNRGNQELDNVRHKNFNKQSSFSNLDEFVLNEESEHLMEDEQSSPWEERIFNQKSNGMRGNNYRQTSTLENDEHYNQENSNSKLKKPSYRSDHTKEIRSEINFLTELDDRPNMEISDEVTVREGQIKEKRKSDSGFISKFHKQELQDFKILMEYSLKHTDEGPISAGNQFHRLTDTVLPLWRIPYEQQLHLKYKHISEVLHILQDNIFKYNKPKRKMKKDNLPPHPVSFMPRSHLPCELAGIRSSGKVRNSSEFSVNVGVDGNPKTVGFYVGRQANRDVVCVPVDHLDNVMPSHKLIAKHFQVFIRSMPYNTCLNYNDGGVWKNILVRSTEDGQMMIVAIINPRELQEDQITDIEDKFKEYFLNGPGKEGNATSILFQCSLKTRSTSDEAPYKVLYGKPHIMETVNDQSFIIRPDSFFQTNTKAAGDLFNSVRDLVGMNRHATVLDTCCGTGAMGIQLAPYVRNVIGIDPVPSAIKDAKVNAEINDVPNCVFYEGTIGKLLPSLINDFEHLSEVIAVINPPKRGLGSPVINHLRMCSAIRKIVYVTCRPAFALSNLDLICQVIPPKNFRTKMPPPFRPTYAIPVDMFPHTPFTEVAIIFERLDKSYGKKY